MKTASLKICISALLVTISVTSNAQSKSIRHTYYGGVRAGYFTGIGQAQTKENLNVPNETYGFRLNAELGYYFWKRISLGAGAGLEGYHSPSINTLPIYLASKFYATTEPRGLYGYTNLGGAMNVGTQFKHGAMAEIGIGLKNQKRRVAFAPEIGVKFQNVQDQLFVIVNTNGQVDRFQTRITYINLAFSLSLIF
jgi:hypothetical protein